MIMKKYNCFSSDISLAEDQIRRQKQLELLLQEVCTQYLIIYDSVVVSGYNDLRFIAPKIIFLNGPILF